MEQTVNGIYDIRVWYVLNADPEPNGFVFFGDVVGDQTNPTIEVPLGTQLLSYTLKTAQLSSPTSLSTVSEGKLLENQAPLTESAHFTTNPIQWVTAEGIPLGTSPSMEIQRFDGQHFQVVDFNGNTTTGAVNHHLRLLVMHQGKVEWSGDPVIVELPPDLPDPV